MTPLYTWAQDWQVPLVAIQDLQRRLGLLTQLEPPPAPQGTGEAWLQSAVRLESSQKGWRMFRNNNGALQDKTGRWVRYGLANDSEQLNKKLKSGDLIGPKPVLIEPWHVGHTIAQFTSLECKPVGWQYTGTEREVAQLAWINMILSLGGDARFVSQVGVL